MLDASVVQNRHVLRHLCSYRQIRHFCSNIIRIVRSDPDISGGVFVLVKSFKLTLQQDILTFLHTL